MEGSVIMATKFERLSYLYNQLSRPPIDKSVHSLVISNDKENIKYASRYQRKFVWKITDCTNLIETILIHGIIPPIVALETNEGIEIIDGRQRYETLLNFYNNKFRLAANGLQKLKNLQGKYYKDLPENLKTIFEDYQIKITLYSAKDNPIITEEDLNLFRHDAYQRFKLGTTPLNNSDVARAKYQFDNLTKKFIEIFKNDEVYFEQCVNVLLPNKHKNKEYREKLNLLLVVIRQLLVLEYIPTINEKTIQCGTTTVNNYYEYFIVPLNDDEILSKIEEFKAIFKKIAEIKEILTKSNNSLKDNILLLKSIYWMLSILYKISNSTNDVFYKFDINQFCRYLEKDAKKYFDNYMSFSPSHIESRYNYIYRYICEDMGLDITEYIEKVKGNKKLFKYKINKNDTTYYDINTNNQTIPTPTTMSISEIVRLIKKNQLIVQPDFQRGEVKDKQKASRIIESILLGVKLPPIYLYSYLEDSIQKYTVLDGQQRLTSILRFMGEPVTGVDYQYIDSSKKQYTLNGLKVLPLNGYTFFSEASDGFKTKMYRKNDKDISEEKKKAILNYPLDIVSFNQQANTAEKAVDNFIRLNQNVHPIARDSFEVWNSCHAVRAIDEIKEIAKYELFKQSGKRMKEEELVTVLAYASSQDIEIGNMEEFFSIYKRPENKDRYNEHYEVQISIKHKKNITDYIEDIEPNSEKEKEFLHHIHLVKIFSEKLKILSDNHNERLIKIFNPNIAFPKKGNVKDFYITWLFLNNFNMHFISTYKNELFKELEEIFNLMKNMPEHETEKNFIQYVARKINIYLEIFNKTV